MKAMVLKEYGKPLVLEEVSKPKIGNAEVLLKVKAAGVCGTDLKIQQGLVPTKKLPLIPGHEIAGVVEEIGQGVKDFKVSDEVLVSYYVSCGNCRSCLAGRETICENLKGRLGFEFNGGFAEYVAVPEACLLPKPSNISFEQAAVVSDAVATSYHAFVRRAGIKEGDYLVIVGGGGGLGLHAIQVAQNLGANIIGIDISDNKLETMRNLGVKKVLNGQKLDWSKAVFNYTDGRGADYVALFACTNDTVREGINSLRKGGKLVFIAYSTEISFNALKCHLNEIDILSTRAATRSDIEDSLELIREAKVKPIISKILTLEELNDGLALIKNGDLTGRLAVNIK
ncbi:MAG: alcohol dehydrogenase, propanol-preferring [Candidatus Atribacteria bacterium]|nr:alcohol dehydrogenase, propanol-preferring [Candidatus Atribacteria bacterium]